MHETPGKGEGFYGLSLAAQMIVWAVRKRLHLLSHGTDDSAVSRAFRTAGLTGLHGALMSIVDVLLCGASSRVQLHAVSCPCLAPHETSLLSALTHLQKDEHAAARWHMHDLMGPTAARLMLPCMHQIVRDLEAQGMHLDPAETSGAVSESLRARGSVH